MSLSLPGIGPHCLVKQPGSSNTANRNSGSISALVSALLAAAVLEELGLWQVAPIQQLEERAGLLLKLMSQA